MEILANPSLWGAVALRMLACFALGSIPFVVALRLTGSFLKWSERGMIASLASWALFTVLMFLLRGPADGGLAAAMTLFLAWRHRTNFQNLISTFERSEAPG